MGTIVKIWSITTKFILRTNPMSDQNAENSQRRVDVVAVDISPNPAPLTDELHLEVDFCLSTPVINGVWDIANSLLCACSQLGQVEAKNYSRGDNHFQFSIPEINVSGIQSSQLTNCGLLIATFKDDDGDILDLKMVVQVSEQRKGLQRIIYSPLE
ncbi:uncharacterized protein PHALS_02173 [Plasmopara halstedii]|uniref:Uncharacterized protein n=1 Tax=Plasmopara halstedii TaxID=4781 RepID=A0A0P1A6L7_PLAHL|nr:uncharacterized protein PHALS_02173 [Plasmopara halstedii]CEG36261.1 hypothetical protein PHALS_02173 [Plasmopara halstedii]|eukprot:XP_024572630.1 hypothetical protein PHALS_02173 [Plasmopara halstedii]